MRPRPFLLLLVGVALALMVGVNLQRKMLDYSQKQAGVTGISEKRAPYARFV
ncbi:MAG: hypothetical protein QF378_05505 [Candidatus Poseidoniia archaeon]|jgi:hypothetical protein|nr:hypothetical protein [Candidatus Poseidoniia archaeon]